jgi:hypothetical protein
MTDSTNKPKPTEVPEQLTFSLGERLKTALEEAIVAEKQKQKGKEKGEKTNGT